MPTVDVIDLNNSKVGEVELSDVVFGAEVNQDLLYESVRHYLAGTRAARAQSQNPATKWLVRARSSGSRRVPVSARMGSVRSLIWR